MAGGAEGVDGGALIERFGTGGGRFAPGAGRQAPTNSRASRPIVSHRPESQPGQ